VPQMRRMGPKAPGPEAVKKGGGVRRDGEGTGWEVAPLPMGPGPFTTWGPFVKTFSEIH